MRHSGQGPRLVDCLDTFTRLTREQLLPGCQVALVLHEKLVDTVGDTLVDLTRLILHVAERLLVRDTEDCGDIVCSVSVEHVLRLGRRLPVLSSRS